MYAKQIATKTTKARVNTHYPVIYLFAVQVYALNAAKFTEKSISKQIIPAAPINLQRISDTNFLINSLRGSSGCLRAQFMRYFVAACEIFIIQSTIFHRKKFIIFLDENSCRWWKWRRRISKCSVEIKFHCANHIQHQFHQRILAMPRYVEHSRRGIDIALWTGSCDKKNLFETKIFHSFLA